MPDVPNLSARHRPTINGPGASRASMTGRSPRRARRKHETRVRLLNAAFVLVAEKGMDGVTISEITEAADVGFGSFYNHFDSKDGIFAALGDWLFDEFGKTLDHVVSGLSDPAEVIAVSVRHTLMRACREPVWGQLLIREGLSARALSRGLGQRLLRDTAKGISEKRFTVADVLMCVISVIGTVLAGVAAELDLSGSPTRANRARNVLRARAEQFAEDTAAIVLQAFGLKCLEAERIARRPLPATSQNAIE